MKPLSIPVGDSFIEGTLFPITLRGHGNTRDQQDSVSRTDNLHDTLTA